MSHGVNVDAKAALAVTTALCPTPVCTKCAKKSRKPEISGDKVFTLEGQNVSHWDSYTLFADALLACFMMCVVLAVKPCCVSPLVIRGMRIVGVCPARDAFRLADRVE